MDDTETPEDTGGRPSTWRIIGAAFLGLLMVPALLVAVTGRWVTGTVLDTGAVSERAQVILAEPAVVSAMGDFLGAELMGIYEENFDFSSALPPALQEEGKVIEAALEAELKAQATSLVGSGAVQELLGQLVTGFHSQMVEVVDEGGTAAKAVTLNLVPVATELMKGLQDQGLLPGDLEIPVIDTALDPADQVAALSKALKIDLPEDMGSVEVFNAEEVAIESKELADARQAVSTVRTVAWVSLLVSFVLLVGIWFASGSRRTAGIIIGATMATSGSLGLVLSSRAPDLVADSIEDALAREALRVTVADLGSGLRATHAALAVVGVVVIASGIWGPALYARMGALRNRTV